jgi:predicted phosphodiesterase
MRIAILSDIHGNKFALEAVLKEIKRKKITKLFCLGDIVGYYYHPSDIFRILKSEGATIILGNHEQLLFDALDDVIKVDSLREKYGSGHRIAIETLLSSEVQELRKKNHSHNEIINDTCLSFFHSSPFSRDAYIYPDSSKDILEKCNTESKYTFIGHSHYAFIAKLSHTTLVNVGSVGQSRQRGGVASWCLLNLENNVLEMQSTPYDIYPLLDLVDKYDPDIHYLSTILKR